MRTMLRGKFTLLFMMLGLLLAVPAVALADQFQADADTLATGTGNHTNTLSANQQPGTTQTYPFSAAVRNTGAANNDVFVASGDKVNVTNTFEGAWVDAAGSTPASFEITAYDVNHSGKISISVPCEATQPQTMTVKLSADPTRDETLADSTKTLSYTITPTGSKSASCPTADAGGPYSGNEGTDIALSGSGTDLENGTLTYAWDLDNDGAFDDSTDQNPNFAAPQVSADTNYTVKLQVTDNQGLTATDTATVTVRDVVNTAPVVSVQGVANDANYEINDVPSATCQVTDAEDTNESASPVFNNSGLNSYGLGSQTVTCSYTDNGPGTPLSDSDSVTYNIVDTGDPVITDQGATTDPNGTNDWYTSAVTNTFKAEDFNGSTPPDAGAGFAGETNPYTFTKGSSTAEGSAVTIASGTVTDVAGNEGASINSAAFQIDLSDPHSIAFQGGPAAGTSYDFGNVPGAPTCSAQDNVSGMPDDGGCVVTGYSNAKGTHTMTATATDNAGRTATATRSYTVAPYRLSGFYQPVDMGGVVNTVKGGSTVPLKFEIFQSISGTEVTSTTGITLTATRTPCEPSSSLDPIEITATGGTSLRYDSTGGQFIYNWKTPTGTGCYTVTMAAADGSTLTAYFKMLK